MIEDNEIAGWGERKSGKGGRISPATMARSTAGTTARPTTRRRPDRIVIQGNRIRDPRHGSNPWRSAAHGRKHPNGPMGVMFERCGRNHVIRYNDIGSANGNHYNDGISGSDNFSAAGFPWADSDIYANRISNVYDDAIEAEGANRNVRIWANHMDRVMVAIANAATTTGPLYVWGNVAERMSDMHDPEGVGKAARGRSSRGAAGIPPRMAGAPTTSTTARRARARASPAPAGGSTTSSAATTAGRRRASIPRTGLSISARTSWNASRTSTTAIRSPAAGARQSGAPPTRFGAEAYKAGRSAD